MKMDEFLKKEIEEDMEKIQVPSSLYDFARNIKAESEVKNIHEAPFLKTRRNRKFHYVAAAVIGLGILTGSAFLSPSIAEMASKIPYLGQVFQTKPVFELIHDALEKEGYKNLALGMTPGEKVLFEIRMEGSEKDADRERRKITGIVEDILKSKGYDSYEVKVTSFIPEVVEETEEEKQMRQLGLKLEEGLRSSGYDIMTVNPYNPKIEVSIPLTEKRVDEIQKATLELAKENGSDKEVVMDVVDVENQKREGLWMDYLRSIHEGLALKKEYKVSSYGYSYKPEKVKIIIKTSMTASDDGTKETVGKIRDEIKAFLDSEDVKAKVDHQPYEVIVRDKSGKDFPF
ncbi:hypothetical protein QE429_004512 [Bacillus sp. SORGH_AS 510]|uniref:DUF4030 domain-containing protein n=1 Tax=Bacillus sp. SORGH_AS_0510 TaxID=3041771 RepID=UPI00277F5D05|nr:DUF4030 domain-containing protein [Bacillus sp. SORGH_AS_0510]MDQ1147685.1 hypothetical protein [Bacillus sp. SORGH_AS_0510]